MPGYLRQATASQARALGPFIDDTDFKTTKTGLTIANTDIKLVVNGAASANKNSGGGTHRVNGVYGVTFDATDTATVGEMEVSVVVSGALPVFDKFYVVEEAVFDALFVASAPGYVVDQPVNATKLAGQAITAAAGVTFPASVASPTNITAGTVTTVTNLTNAPTSGDFTSTMKTSIGTAVAASAVASVTGAVGSVTGLTASDVGAIKAKTDNLPSDPADASDVLASTSAIYSRIGAPAGASIAADVAAVKVDTAAVKTQTDKLVFTVAGKVNANVLYVNGTQVTGDGHSGTEWGPA